MTKRNRNYAAIIVSTCLICQQFAHSFGVDRQFFSSRQRSLVDKGVISHYDAATISATRFSAATGISLGDMSVVRPEESTSSANKEGNKVGVLFLNLGGPTTGEDVEEFLYNLFADPDIIRLPGPLSPLQNTIAMFIAKRRAPKSRAAYESIGGGSPILKYSNAQADLVAKSLRERYNLDVNTYIGMRYWKPFTEDALDKIRKDGIQALVILPLYPQFSISTSGSSLRVLQEEFSKHSSRYGDMVHTVVPAWYDRPGYVKAMTDLIQNELDSFTDEEIAEAKQVSPNRPPKHILFSAHGVPKSYIEAGDPYQKQMELCVEGIKKELYKTNSPDDVQIHLSYQSRVGPIEWLRPYTDDVLPELGESGVRNLVVVPISFVSEHIETLEEIDIEYRELAHESGVTNWRRCPAPNTDATFIQDMADMVYEALMEPSQTVTEACVANNIEGVNLERFDDAVAVTGVLGVGADGDLYEVDGPLQSKERINARAAMAGVLLTILLELASGKPLTHFLGF
ncbi:ferrochelatase [Nitzschia inconspicua]|uniref:Ferrochelatase n=1 Tax=Nitzschia inconspicua TaxID=303405 RepID=A0A9K3KZ69_9STRA|nr:ferrochelatase [Nitzschia inconspicua]